MIQENNKQIIIEPDYFYGKMPRWLELIINLIFLNLLLAILINVGIFDLTKSANETHFRDIQSLLFYVLWSFFPIIYFIGRTRTFVNQIIIDNLIKKITIYYSFLFIFNRKCEIFFSDFVFTLKDTSGWGNSYTKVQIYKRDNNVFSKKVTIISKENGWKSGLINELIEIFNIINFDNKNEKN